ncbi:MAG: molybdopterin-dependent oxidoreductase [Vicinamibacterales bacterium]
MGSVPSRRSISRRAALRWSGVALIGAGPLATIAAGQAPAADFPETLVDQKVRDIVALPLNPDGSAKQFTAADLTPVGDIGVADHNGKKPVPFEADATRAKIRIHGNVSKKRGSLGLGDLQTLPSYSQITRLQCGAPKPAGVIKWTGARFTDVCRLLGVDPMAQYVMFVAGDGYITTEDMSVAAHPQSMIAWAMNDAPIPAAHGAPFRFVIPTRWGGRNIKRVTEIRFTATGFGFNNS